MNKLLLASFLLFSLVLTGCFNRGSLGGAQDNSFSGSLTASSTATNASTPVLVLDVNGDRRYALIQNDSDTVMYLHPVFFASEAAALTGGVAVNKGIRLNANGGSWEIKSENLYLGQVYATSTAASKAITFVEK